MKLNYNKTQIYNKNKASVIFSAQALIFITNIHFHNINYFARYIKFFVIIETHSNLIYIKKLK